MSAIDSILMQYGQKRDIKGLQDYMETVNNDKVSYLSNMQT